jgi:fido (protein-threonine AMPylation protein)
MTSLYQMLCVGPQDLESFAAFLTRVHSDFQLIHLFRDGNGRIGRLVLNILSLKRGYPLLVFSPDTLFSKAVEEAHLKRPAMFERMILEAWCWSLSQYEIATSVALLHDPQGDPELEK